MHVDGFRFDLAPVLARELLRGRPAGLVLRHHPAGPDALAGEADRRAVGRRRPGGYQVGNFPVGWAEWNGKYRDGVRDFWRGERRAAGRSSRRASPARATCTSRADGAPTRASTSSPRTTASCLTDLVSYSRSTTRQTARTTATAPTTTAAPTGASKGRPTTRARRTTCAGACGATSSPRSPSPRECGCCSRGDELGRTQHGNNNAYCQDNEISWIDWDLDADDRELLEFTRETLRIFRANPVFRRRGFFAGRPLRGRQQGRHVAAPVRPRDDRRRLERRRPEGRRDADRRRGHGRGRRARPAGVRGAPCSCSSTAASRHAGFVLPNGGRAGMWEELVNTARPGRRVIRRSAVNLVGRSFILATLTSEPAGE